MAAGTRSDNSDGGLLQSLHILKSLHMSVYVRREINSTAASIHYLGSTLDASTGAGAGTSAGDSGALPVIPNTLPKYEELSRIVAERRKTYLNHGPMHATTAQETETL